MVEIWIRGLQARTHGEWSGLKFLSQVEFFVIFFNPDIIAMINVARIQLLSKTANIDTNNGTSNSNGESLFNRTAGKPRTYFKKPYKKSPVISSPLGGVASPILKNATTTITKMSRIVRQPVIIINFFIIGPASINPRFLRVSMEAKLAISFNGYYSVG